MVKSHKAAKVESCRKRKQMQVVGEAVVIRQIENRRPGDKVRGHGSVHDMELESKAEISEKSSEKINHLHC